MSLSPAAASVDEAARQQRVRRGFLAALSAYLIWGVAPLFFHALSDLSPLEIIAHRVVWGAISISIVVAFTGGWVETLAILRAPRKALLFVGSAAAVSINWLIFVHATTTGRGLDASLGYYIFPLVSVLLAALFFQERFSRRQSLALGVVSCGVLIMIIARGTLPWIPLGLALTFGLYGVLRKMAPAESLVGLLVETLILLPFSLGFLAWQAWQGDGLLHMPGRIDLWALLIIGTPLWTGLPLFLFAVGARRLPLSTVGLMQYINPTSQFFLATLVFRETFTVTHAVTFGLIWLGLALYSWPQSPSSGSSLKSS